VLVVLSASLAIGPGAAFAGPRSGNHCLTPVGDDLNEVFGTTDAFVAPFCSEVAFGERWRPIGALFVAGSDYVFPPGYVPSRSDLVADFLAKFVSARYVVDPGTARERSYTFARRRLVFRRRALPDGTQLVRWTTPSMHPLLPGDHSVRQYVTLTADVWDGLGVDPAVNLVPAGVVLWDFTPFNVVLPDRVPWPFWPRR
jgi:hypothetical protein